MCGKGRLQQAPGPGPLSLGLGGLLLRAMVARTAFPGVLPWLCPPSLHHSAQSSLLVRLGPKQERERKLTTYNHREEEQLWQP